MEVSMSFSPQLGSSLSKALCFFLLLMPFAHADDQTNRDNQTKKKRMLRPFAKAGVTPKYARDLPFLIQHLRLEATILPKERSIKGEVSLRIKANQPSIRSVTLDAAELQIHAIHLNEKPVRWQGEGQKLHIELGEEQTPKKPFLLRIRYSAKPRNGLYFILTDKDYPKKPTMVFSQGESENNRFWYPSFDSTNMRFTSETLFTVPKPFQAISNGRFLGQSEKDGMITYHHKMEQPHVNYLLSVVVGEFVVYAQRWRDIPIRSFVSPEDKDKAPISFLNTPDMMDFFSRKIGVPYPYPKYDQIVVRDFVAGGMENITATTLTHRTLQDARSRLDERSDDLVAHELAHQWFGDLLTCKDWSHIWLNESFATYFNHLYTEHRFGKDDFDLQRLRSRRSYFGEGYRRPIVTRLYEEPGDVFDRHAYPKGAAVLHMIRKRLGDTLWWKAIQHYTSKHAHGLVETGDLRRALEAVSGLNWEPFFDQWIYRAGHPQITMSWRYDDKTKLVEATFQQTQKEAAFSLETTLTWLDSKGVRHTLPVHLRQKSERVLFVAPHRPALLMLDEASDLLMDLKVKQSWQAWKQQALSSPHAIARLHALEALRDFPNQPEVREILTKVLQDEALHYGLRQAAAASLGHLAEREACSALHASLRVKESRARTAILYALKRFPEIVQLETLRTILSSDPSYHARAATAHLAAALRHKESFAFLEEAYKQTEHYGTIRIAALQAMVALEDPRGLPYIERSLERGMQRIVRLVSLTSYVKLLRIIREKTRRQDIERLEKHLRDPDPFIRSATLQALGLLGDRRAIPTLQRFAAQETTQARARDARRAIEAIQKQEKQLQRLQRLGRSIESIRLEQRKLRERLQRHDTLLVSPQKLEQQKGKR